MLTGSLRRIFKAILTFFGTHFPYLKTYAIFPTEHRDDEEDHKLHIDSLTLFSHGMACIHHQATIKDNTTLTMTIPPQQMNDVLKTLSIIDQTGVIQSVTYDAPIKSQHFLKNDDDVLTTLITQSQGALVNLVHHNTTTKGRLIGLQTISHHNQTTKSIVILQQNDEIVTVKLSNLSSLKFLDKSLQTLFTKQLQQSALSALSSQNILVNITTHGQGTRLLSTSYAVESPLYKLTYRFLLHSHNLVLQAWAIIDNPSDQHLEQVQVIIVSALPISFRHNLYNARFITRPLQQVVTHAGVGPPSAMKPRPAVMLTKKKNAYDTCVMSSSQTDEDDQILEGSLPPAPPPVELAMPSTQAHQFQTPRWTPAAEAAAAGSVHEYRVRERVTIRPRESALLPLIMTTCKGGPVDLYSYDIRPTNTLRAVTIFNDTPAPFETGPVAVYDQHKLVGEGMLNTCRPGKQECVPYCVNLDCVVERSISHDRGAVVECLGVGGSFLVRRSVEMVTNYQISAKKDGVNVIVVHKLANGYDPPCAFLLPPGITPVSLEDGEHLDAVSIEEGLARYRVDVTAGGNTRLRITEQRLESVNREIRDSCTTDNIAYLLREEMVGQTAAERMRQVMDTQIVLNRVQGDIVVLEKSVKDAENSQARYRENVIALGGAHGRTRHTGLVSEYVDRIRESETRIEELRQDIEQKRVEKRELVDKIDGIIADFDKKSALV